MNLPDDYGAFFERCAKGHVWHKSEGHQCLRCSHAESDRDAKRAYWPLHDSEFTFCPEGRDDREECIVCGWPGSRHIPF